MRGAGTRKSKPKIKSQKGDGVAQTKHNRSEPKNPSGFLDILTPRLKESVIIGQLLLALLLAASLYSFNPADPGWTFTGSSAEATNWVGTAGAWLADFLLVIFGITALCFPLLLLIPVAKRFLNKDQEPWIPALLMVQGVGLLMTVAACTVLSELHFYHIAGSLREGSGGVIGQSLSAVLLPAVSYLGSTLLMLALLLLGITLMIEISWLTVIDQTGRLTSTSVGQIIHKIDQYQKQRKRMIEVGESSKARQIAREELAEKTLLRKPVRITKRVEKIPEISERAAREKQGNLFKTEAIEGLPALSLLDAREIRGQRGYSEHDLEALSRLLELKLRDYGVEAEVVAVFPGPVITRFEIQPAAGVKVSRISGLAKDLARSLAVISVRVVEVIPGKPVVGIEIPNEDREIVRLSQVLTSRAYDESASPLSLALGHDIAGEPVVVDLGKMPHLLVAGTTGSGKSVGINAMILSLLFKASPDEVRLIMVDPKMLELAVYEGIPHLLTPVVTDMKDAANALRWCVAEMERRYRLMAAMGVRNVGGFNRKVKDAAKAGSPIPDPLWRPDPLSEDESQTAPDLETLPFIVVIIDEFADMMMIVGKKVEELIARIAQKARAAGIHLVLATQRPSVDVITGLIKANVPTRIAFQVSSKIDSRTILDQGGAEQLLGHGDMLYMPGGTPIPIRVHGAFVDDDEVHRVVESWKSLGAPNYLDAILDSRSDSELLPGSGSEAQEAEAEADPLYDEAVAFVTDSGRASISAVQRKLRIGYNRAARMVEEMEHAGVVSAMNSNGSREVLAHAPPD
jgi:DNA segregation ATPase FtsK/SpoIIIE, S-DNA-T family